MLRLLLIFSLVGYVLYKFGFFRVRIHQHPNQNFNRPNDNAINIDNYQKTKKPTKFDGGEYIDYEEVKKK